MAGSEAWFVDVWEGLNVRLAISEGETAMCPAKCRCTYISEDNSFCKAESSLGAEHKLGRMIGSPAMSDASKTKSAAPPRRRADAPPHDRAGADGALRARQHARRRHLWPDRKGRGPGRQRRVARLRRRAGRGAAHRALLRLARLALSARGGRGLCHPARLWLSAAELPGRARAGLFGAHLDRHAKPGIRR